MDHNPFKNWLTEDRYVFKSELKSKKCKHEWVMLSASMERGGFLSSGTKVKVEYLYCPKCDSKVGDDVK